MGRKKSDWPDANGEAKMEGKPKAKSKNKEKKKSSSDVRHVSATKIVYTAATGTEYQIDVEKMSQKNLLKGTVRAIFHKPVLGDSAAWYYDATFRKGHLKLVRYPIDICIALESISRLLDAAPDPKPDAGVVEGVQVDDSCLEGFFRGLSTSEISSSRLKEDPNPPEADLTTTRTPSSSSSSTLGQQLHEEAASQAGRDRLFSRFAEAAWTSDVFFPTATRWLIAQQFKPDGVHCRKAAFCANLQVLKILLMEGKADVRGLELLQDGKPANRSAAGIDDSTTGSGGSGWVQRCKWPIKVLLARGAVLGGSSAPTSKLLKRLEEDGDRLWAQRALDGLTASLPDCCLTRIGLFLGVPLEAN